MNYKPRKLRSVTLVELLIVVGIITVVTAAIIPSYIDFVSKREFKNSADQFAGDVRAVQAKAISGVVVKDESAPDESILVDWGIRPNCGGNSYALSYGYDSGTSYEKRDLVTKTLPEDVEFADVTGGCGDIFFARTVGSPIISTSVSSIRLKYKNELTRDVVVTEAGLVKIEIIE